MIGPVCRSVEVNGRSIHYQLRRADRKTLSITVEPDGRVMVIAPNSAAIEVVDAKVQRRSGWIRRQQKYFEALPPSPAERRWISGETHRYLGRQYRLKLMQGPETSVRLLGGYFVVTMPKPSEPAAVQAAMDSWYRERARDLLPKRLKLVFEASTWIRLPEAPKLTLRRMRTRWGSTTSGQRICLNVDLVKVPLGCIDYVVAHEFVHLQIPNHGTRFWQLLGRVAPGWERWRDRLALQEV